MIKNLRNTTWFPTVYWMIAIFCAVMLWQCDENPQPVALTERVGEIVVDTLYAIDDTLYTINRRISTLNTSSIYLGSANGYTFRLIMRFSNFPDADSMKIDTAWIRFPGKGIYVDKNTTPVEFTASGYPIINEWSSDTVDVWDDYESNVDFSSSIGNLTVTTSQKDSIYFHFNEFGLQRLNAWVDTVASGIPNNGFALDFTSANFAKEFQGRDAVAAAGPYLFFHYTFQKDTTINGSDTTVTRETTDSLLAIQDAYKFTGEFLPIAERLHITSLDTPWVTLLKFDLEVLKQRYPLGIIIENANLQLPVDWENTLLNENRGANLQLLPLASELSDSNVKINSSYLTSGLAVSLTQFSDDSTYIETTEGTARQILARQYIQAQLNNPNFSEGFYIEDRTPSEHLSTSSYFRHNYQNPQRRPRLILTSVKLPEERL
jgi:hypothetical protein